MQSTEHRYHLVVPQVALSLEWGLVRHWGLPLLEGWSGRYFLGNPMMRGLGSWQLVAEEWVAAGWGRASSVGCCSWELDVSVVADAAASAHWLGGSRVAVAR